MYCKYPMIKSNLAFVYTVQTQYSTVLMQNIFSLITLEENLSAFSMMLKRLSLFKSTAYFQAKHICLQ